MQERQQRVPFTRPVFIAPIQGPGRSHRLLTGNISEGGMFVRSDARFDPGTPVSVSLEARGQVFPFAQGEVIWDADAERLPTTGGLPGFGIKFTGFLNEGSPALLSHLVYRGPGVNVSDHLTNQLGGDAPIPAAAPEVPTLPMDFMSMPLDELGDAEPEVEWPEGIVLPDAITREPVQADVASRPSFRLDLEGERAEMAPAEPAAVTPDQARRVAIGTAVAIGVLIVASVLLLRSRNDTPATDAGAPQQFEAMDLTAAPSPVAADPIPAPPTPSAAPSHPVAPPRAAIPVETTSEAVATPAPKKELPVAPRKVAPPPAPAETLSLGDGAIRRIQASRDGRTLQVSLTLAPGARIERAFALSSPSRLVFDVVGSAPRASLHRDADLPEVKSVRVGAREGGTRLVLDLDRAAAKVVTTQTGARVTLK